MRRPMPYTIEALFAILLAAPIVAQAQNVCAFDPVHVPITLVGAGVSLPSGGDFSDTYNGGYHVMAAVQVPISERYALRGGLLYALYVAQSPPRHPNPDRSRGSTLAATVDGAYTLPSAGLRPYLFAGVGYYRVRATWLRDDGSIEPLTTRNTFGYSGGLGVRFRQRLFVEVRHDGAYRKVENWARFIPVSVGYTF